MKRILVPILLALAPLAQAKNGILYTKQIQAGHRSSNPKLIYFGGPVISNANIVLVYWGEHIKPSIKNNFPAYYNALAQSTYLDWLEQYNTFGHANDGKEGTHQHIAHGSYLGAVTIHPKNNSHHLTDDDIQAELQYQIDQGNLPKPDDNTVYMTHFDNSTGITAFGMHSCQQFCAYHGFKGTPEREHFYYGVMPDIGECMTGCGYGGDFVKSEQAISSHELVEAITDPYPTPGTHPTYPQAWNDKEGSEIADICAGSNNLLKSASNKFSYIVQSEWDNSKNRCSTGTWQAP